MNEHLVSQAPKIYMPSEDEEFSSDSEDEN